MAHTATVNTAPTVLHPSAVTLLVLEPGQHVETAGPADWLFFDLADGAAEVLDQLAVLAAENHLETTDLIVAGVEFSDPERLFTTVALTGLDAVAAVRLVDSHGERHTVDNTIDVLKDVQLVEVSVPELDL